jgi:hypothetical protein
LLWLTVVKLNYRAVSGIPETTSLRLE